MIIYFLLLFFIFIFQNISRCVFDKEQRRGNPKCVHNTCRYFAASLFVVTAILGICHDPSAQLTDHNTKTRISHSGCDTSRCHVTSAQFSALDEYCKDLFIIIFLFLDFVFHFFLDFRTNYHQLSHFGIYFGCNGKRLPIATVTSIDIFFPHREIITHMYNEHYERVLHVIFSEFKKTRPVGQYSFFCSPYSCRLIMTSVFSSGLHRN